MPGKIHVPVTVATAGFEAMQRQFSRLRGATLGLSAAIGGLAVASRAIDFTGAGIQGARDLERNYAGLASVFKESTEQMKEFGQTASEIGLSMNEAAKATTFIGSVLKQSGFSIAETSDLTEELVELGADLALTYGYDVQEALLGMTALFRGEYDPIEKFGVAMKQSEIDAEKLARGLDGLTGAEERFADQQIRVEFLMERAADAIGAFDRQSGNLTVQQMRLRAEFENVRDTMAADLLPAIADFTGGLREIVQDVGPKLESTFTNLAPVLDKVAQDILPFLSSAIENTIKFADQLIELIAEAQDPTTELGDSMQALGESLASLFGTVSEEGPTLEEVFDGIAEALEFLADVGKVVVDTLETFRGVIPPVAAAVLTYKVAAAGAAGATGAWTAALLANPVVATTAAVVGLSVALGMAVAEQRKVNELTFEGAQLNEQGQVVLKEGVGAQVDYLQTTSYVNDAVAEYNRLLALQAEGTQLTSDEMIVMAQIEGELGAENIELIKQNQTLIAQAPDVKSGYYNTAEGVAELRNKTADAYIQQLNLNAALGKFAALASTAVDTSSLDGILQASSGKGMGGGQVGWDAEEYLKGLGLITPDGKDGAVTGTIQDYVGDFFGKITDSVAQEEARADLTNIGFSEALIEQILGSQGWEEVYDEIKAGGRSVAESLQADFAKTSAGIAEQQKALEDYNEKIKAINESGANIKTVLDGLVIDPSASSELGEFEAAVVDFGATLEKSIEDAFGDDPAFATAKANLTSLANTYIDSLSRIERKRDQTIAQRDFATDIIFGTARAISAAGQITQLFSDINDQAQEIEVTEVVEGIVDSADGLREFKTTVTRNYTEPLNDSANASERLTERFREVLERTRSFAENLTTLQDMGLDPALFKQLVDAGAEAGGATAEALIAGGPDTIAEMNSLQTQIEDYGVDIGETAYEVTKNSGEQFVSGIIDGLEAQVTSLEQQAESMADVFATEFATELELALKNAMDEIDLPDFSQLNPGGGGGSSTTPSPGDFGPGEITSFNGIDVFKIRVQEAGTTLAQIASQFDVPLAKLKDVNPKLFDPNHPDYKAGYKQGDYLFSNMLLNIPQLAEGGIALDSMIAMIGEAGPEAVIPLNKLNDMRGGGDTYNINVTANTRAGGAAAGEEIIKALKAYQRQNRRFDRELTGFGA